MSSTPPLRLPFGLSSLAACLATQLLGGFGCATTAPAAAGANTATSTASTAPSPLPSLAGAATPVLVESAVKFVSLEGPLWADHALLFSDVDASKAYRLDPLAPVATRTTPLSFPRQTNGIAQDPQGRLIFCERAAGQVTRVETDGKLTVLADKFEGKRFNAANDLTVRADGNIYFTDPKWGRAHDDELGFEGAFRRAPDGKVSLVTRDMTRPNGIALSPHGDVLYVGDDTANEIRRFDVAADGSVSGEKPFISQSTVAGKHFATPDGICMDLEGNLYVANNNDAVHAVIAFSPEGQVLGEVPFPGNPSNCTFGGPDGKTLYATVGTAIYSVRMPKAGTP